MSSIISFSKQQLQKLENELKNACKTGNVRLYRVVQALIYIGDKDSDISFDQIASFLNVTRKTIYNWLMKFMCDGFKWLKNDPFNFSARGRRPRLNKDQKAILFEMVKEGPEKNGFYCGIWTCAMIGELIFVKFGMRYNTRYLSTFLKKMGLSYQKAKKENAIILFGDEVSFAMWGSLGRTWGVIGQQPEVKTKGCRKGLKMFGAIGFKQGEFIYMESLAYTIIPKALKLFKEDGIPEKWVNQIKVLKNRKFENKESYLNALEELIGKEAVKKHEAIWLKHTETAGKFNGENYVKFLKKIVSESTSKLTFF